MSRQKYNKEIICPYCDHKHEDSYEYFNYRSCDGDTTEIECANCEGEFEVEVHISWEFSSTIKSCKKHKLDFDKYTNLTIALDGFDKAKYIMFECKNCFEEFYDWHLPKGQYPKMKEGQFEFVGKAKELMNKEKSDDDKR